MGRQLNFYMNKNVEDAFFDMLMDKKFTFLVDNRKDDCVDAFSTREQVGMARYCFLHRKENGNFLINYADNGIFCGVDFQYSPVIDFMRTRIVEEEKIVHRGRLWVSTLDFKDEANADKISLLKDYNSLVG